MSPANLAVRVGIFRFCSPDGDEKSSTKAAKLAEERIAFVLKRLKMGGQLRGRVARPGSAGRRCTIAKRVCWAAALRDEAATPPKPRVKSRLREDGTHASQVNETRVTDFVRDRLATGHKIRRLTFADTFSSFSSIPASIIGTKIS
jgi:hypothetical protein